jgi:hypothetical protein
LSYLILPLPARCISFLMKGRLLLHLVASLFSASFRRMSAGACGEHGGTASGLCISVFMLVCDLFLCSINFLVDIFSREKKCGLKIVFVIYENKKTDGCIHPPLARLHKLLVICKSQFFFIHLSFSN